MNKWPGPHGECGVIDDLSLITKPTFYCLLWEDMKGDWGGDVS